jgi:hypothetical protein
MNNQKMINSRSPSPTPFFNNAKEETKFSSPAMKYKGSNREESKSPSLPSDAEDHKTVPERATRGSKKSVESSSAQNGKNQDLESKKSNMREVLMRVNNQYYN